MTKQTPLHQINAELGANFTDFGGWDMPLKYGSELAEHRAVREFAGIFDLSHMGEVRVTGADAAAFMDYALLSRYSIMKNGKAKYGVIIDEAGGLLDDVITYRLGDDEFLIVPNAGNTPAVVAALEDRAEKAKAAGAAADFEVRNESDDTALIAVQGPKSEEILLAAVCGSTECDNREDCTKIKDLEYYAWTFITVDGVEVFLARTGYTGEDGFELYIKNADAEALWNRLMSINEAEFDGAALPCGLASRDSLRLEAGMPLYGNELTRETTPFDAGFGGMVRGALKNKGDFYGRETMQKLGDADQAEGTPRKLVGLSSEGRRAARAGAGVFVDGAEVGVITSGQPSPTLGHPIALAYLDTAHAEPGTAVTVDIRGKSYDFSVVETPFYNSGAH